MHTSSAIRGMLSIVAFAAILFLAQSSLEGQTRDKNGKVDGKIDERNGRIVKVNLGTILGVQKGDTLDVYHLVPEPRHLGVIQIVEAFDGSSVAELIQGDYGSIFTGDLVTSKLPPLEGP